MESMEQVQVDLFGSEVPNLDEIQQYFDYVYANEMNLLGLQNQVEENLSSTAKNTLLATGIGLYILGRYEQAAEKLAKSSHCLQKFVYLAYSLRNIGQFDESLAALDNAAKQGMDALQVTLEKVETFRKAGDTESAQKLIDDCANYEKVSANFHYQRGRLREFMGDYVDAAEDYKTAIELEPNHSRALFHLAYRCDLAGDESAAIDYYTQITKSSRVYVSALLNLAVIYEDIGEFEKASHCVDRVLMSHPNHARARLFRKDIESSMTMYYDEEKERRKSRKNKILETPISDFELSVRSRNCLKKMHIDTLGDLLQITEAELLSYKNFGETSLREIRAILEPRGLRLGMALEDKHMSMQEDTYAAEQDADEGILSKPVDDLNLSVRSRTCVAKLNLHSIGELIRKTEAELLGVKNFGVTSLNEIKKALASLGLSLRTLE